MNLFILLLDELKGRWLYDLAYIYVTEVNERVFNKRSDTQKY